jgi:putative ABC transport system substrate-binding protein
LSKVKISGSKYRWADNDNERLPALAAELVRANAAVIIAAGNGQTALAVKAATAAIPIVFQNGSDPVNLGLVASLNRPGGNITGITDVTVETAAKRFELACELVPSATAVGYLQNSRNPNADRVVKEIERAGKTLGREVIFTSLTSESNLAETFAPLVQRHAGALAVAADPIFSTHRDQLVKLAARHAIPTIFSFREFVVAGGLASYGNDILDVYRHVAGYTARILKGEKPTDLPVVQATKYELVLNTKTAKVLGLDVPRSMLMRVDEVIE